MTGLAARRAASFPDPPDAAGAWRRHRRVGSLLANLYDADDDAIVGALILGDDRAMAELVRRHQHSMIHVALNYVRDRGTAEEVVQDTWVVVVSDIRSYEGRGTLKNWIYGILVNIAKARGVRDNRVVPHQLHGENYLDAVEQSSDSSARRRGSGREDWEFPWGAPAYLRHSVEDIACNRDELAALVRAIESLPVKQRAVIYLRDVRGLTPREVCATLGISDGAQRVFLHRARSRVCAAVSEYHGEAHRSTGGED